MIAKYFKKIFITSLILSFIFVIGSFAILNTNTQSAAAATQKNYIFKDTALEQAVKKILKNDLSASSLKSLKVLNIKGANVHDLSGIEHLNSLETITLDGYKVNSITPLKNLKKLKKINMFEMSFKTYKDAYAAFLKSRINVKIPNKELENAVKEEIYSKEYSYDMKRLTLLDVENIYSLDLENSNIKSLNGIEVLMNLNTINLSNTQINDFSPLHKLKNLKNVYYINSSTLKDAEENLKKSNLVVNFKDKQFEELIRNALNKPKGEITQSDMLNITKLNILFSTIKDIPEISYCTNLKSLEIDQTCITDISPLKSLKNLEQLVIAFNDIKDYSALKYLPNIEYIYIPITSDEIFSIVCNMPKLTNIDGISFDDYKTAIKSAKEIAANLIKPGMSDYEKYIIIHDYIVENTNYDIESLNNDSLTSDSRRMTSILNKKSGVCVGYSEAFSYLLNICGIDNKIVAGEMCYNMNDDFYTSGHVWNMVKLDNKWYYCDITFDDSSVIKNNQSNLPNHNFIFLSNDQTSLQRYWLKDVFPKVVDDNPLFVDFRNGVMTYCNNFYYFIGNSSIHSYSISSDITEDFLKVNAKLLKNDSGHLYYINQDDNNSLYRVALDDSKDNKKVVNINVDNYYISNDYLYFTSKESPGIYRSKLDGSEFTKLNNDITNKLLIYKDNIYYTNSSDNNCLYKINLNGDGRIKISECGISETNTFDRFRSDFNIVDDTIYYINIDDGNKLYKMNCDGTLKVKLSDDICTNLEVIKGFIYYVNAEDSGHYRINMNTSEKVKIGVWNR